MEKATSPTKAKSTVANTIASSKTTATSEFNSLATGLKTAATEFRNNDRAAALATATAAIKPLSGLGLHAWRFTSAYTRRHPIRMAITVIGLGLFAAKLLRSKPSDTDEAMAENI